MRIVLSIHGSAVNRSSACCRELSDSNRVASARSWQPLSPAGVSAISIPGRTGGGFSFHEAAGSRSLRRFIIQPAEVFLLPAMVAGVFSRSARAGCVRAGRGFECEVLFHK